MLYFLHGQDAFRLTQKLREIENQYAKIHGSSLNLAKLDVGQITFKDFLDLFNQQSMFVKKKLFFIANVFANDLFKKQLSEKLTALNQSKDIVVIVEKDKLKQSDGLFKKLLKTAKSQEFALLTGPKLLNYIKKELAKYGAQIDYTALQQLSLQGSDPWQLAQLIKQLASHSKKITSADIDLFSKQSQQAEIFKTIDCLAAGNKKTALKMLEDHFRAGDSPFYLLTMFAYQFRNLLLVKSAKGDYSAQKKLGLHPFVLRKTTALASRFTFGQLKAAFQKILATDRAIKTSALTPETALRLLVAVI